MARTQHHDRHDLGFPVVLQSLEDANAADAGHFNIQEHELRKGKLSISVLPGSNI